MAVAEQQPEELGDYLPEVVSLVPVSPADLSPQNETGSDLLALTAEFPGLISEDGPATAPVRTSHHPHRSGQSADGPSHSKTNTKDDLRRYLDGMNRYPLLTAEEEIDLAKQVGAGQAALAEMSSAENLSPEHRSEIAKQISDGTAARERLVNSNLRLVVNLAGKYHGKLKLDEAIQEGNIGLIKAVDGFDWRKGFRFSSYAYQCIIREIKVAKRDRFDDIRIPAHMGALISKTFKTRAYMISDLGRNPSLDELSAELNVSKDYLEEIIGHHSLQPLSLNRQLDGAGDSSELTLEDTVADQRAGQELVGVESMPNGIGLAETIKRLLNSPEALALTYAYDLTDSGARLTPRQIAPLIENTDESDGALPEMSASDVRHLKKHAEAKLRHPAVFAALNKAAPNMPVPSGDVWKNQAECAAVLVGDNPPPLDIFFPLAEKAQPHNIFIAFDPREQFCGNCAVRDECLSYGIARKGYLPGFWGGVYIDNNGKDSSQRLLKATDATD